MPRLIDPTSSITYRVTQWLLDHPGALAEAQSYQGGTADLRRQIAKELNEREIGSGVWFNSTNKLKKIQNGQTVHISPEVRRAAKINADRRELHEQAAQNAGIPIAGERVTFAKRLEHLERLCISLAEELGLNPKE